MTSCKGSFLRVREVADELGVSPSRAYRLIGTGIIPAIRVGGRILIPQAAWAEWLRVRSAEALANLQMVRGEY
jgi:excisionase family DNA binding protein